MGCGRRQPPAAVRSIAFADARTVLGSFWFRSAISVVVLVVLLARLDAREAGRALAAVDLRLWSAALATDAAARAVMIGRWTVLLRAAGSALSGWSTARMFFIASFVGTALPAGGADVARAYAASLHTPQQGLAAASVVVDRLLGLAALLTLGAASLVLGLADADTPLARPLAGVSFAVAVALLGAFGADYLARWTLPARMRGAPVGRWLLDAAGQIARYRTQPRVLAAVFGLSLLVQWLRVAEVFLAGASLGLDVGFGYYLVFMPLGLIAFMLPISIAGLGLPQGVMMWVLQPAGVPEAQAFALSTLVVVLGLVGTLPGLYLYIRARGVPA